MPVDTTSNFLWFTKFQAPKESEFRSKVLSQKRGILGRFCNWNGQWKLQAIGYEKQKGWTKKSAQNHFKSYKNESAFHRQFMKIRKDFVNVFGEQTGLTRFWSVVTKNNWNVAKPYSLHESLSWFDDVLEFLREDETGKYFHCWITGKLTSFNRHDYSDVDFVQSAQHTSFLPINISHDHSRWLPFPENRMEILRGSDLAIEGIMRLAHDQTALIAMLADEKINHISLEGFKTSDGVVEFSAIALLEEGVKPGIPQTFVEPIMFAPELSESLCKLVGDRWVCGRNVSAMREDYEAIHEEWGELHRKVDALEGDNAQLRQRVTIAEDVVRQLKMILEDNGILIVSDEGEIRHD